MRGGCFKILQCQPRWLSGLRRSHVHSLMIARRSLCPEKLGSNPGQGRAGINFSGWHGLDMAITVTETLNSQQTKPKNPTANHGKSSKAANSVSLSYSSNIPSKLSDNSMQINVVNLPLKSLLMTFKLAHRCDLEIETGFQGIQAGKCAISS